MVDERGYFSLFYISPLAAYVFVGINKLKNKN